MLRLQPEMFSSDGYILEADMVLTAEGESPDTSLAVKDGRVAAIGTADEVNKAHPGLHHHRLDGCAIIPGLVDAHHHILDPFAKSMTFGEPAQMWRHIWMPLEATATEEDCYIGAKWSFLEAMRGGVTCVVDHAMRSPEMIAGAIQAAEETGIRFVTSVGAYDLKDIDSPASENLSRSSIDKALKMADRHLANCSGRQRIHGSVACGNIQNNTPEMIARVSQFCREAGALFQVHANEHTPEVHYSVTNYSKRPIELLHSIDALGPQTLIAHATLVTASEVNLLRDTDTAVSYNPVASMWKGNAVAPALTYLRQGIRVGIGSDATRNDGLRMLEAAETLQRVTYGIPNDDFSCGAGWIWIDAATRGGARAAGLANVTGELRTGMEADFVILDMTAPEVSPSWDFSWELVRFYDRSNIVGIFVAGRPTVLGGNGVQFDSDTFIDEYRSYTKRRVIESGVSRVHGPSRQYRLEQNSRY